MNFKEKRSPKTTVRAVEKIKPVIYINADALTKMFIYTDECSDEIGWLGTVQKLEDNQYYIDDVYLFHQEVHGATTEITPEGLSTFGEQILAQPDGMDIWNSIKMWGHSHVNMAVFASGQDDKQMDEFANVGHEWFIRLICNKKGDMTVDFFNYDLGVAFLDVPWIEVANQEEQDLMSQIRKLEEELNVKRETRTTLLSEAIKLEMKEKVKKKWSGVTVGGYTSPGYSNAYGYRDKNGIWVRYDDEQNELDEKKTNSVKTNSTRGSTTVTDIGKKKDEEDETNADEYDEFLTDDDVTAYFTVVELCDLSQLETIDDLKEELEVWGEKHITTDNDFERIFRVAMKTNAKWQMYK